MNPIADKLENLTRMLRSVLEKQKLPSERNHVHFERSKNAILQRMPDPVTAPKAYQEWLQEIAIENRRSHTLPYDRSREYLHAAIFAGDPSLHDVAMDNTHLTSKEDKLLRSLPIHAGKWTGPESADNARAALRKEGDRCAARNKVVLYKADGDKHYTNHAHSAPLWKQMVTLYSQPNNLHALDDLIPATPQDAEPAPFRKLRELRQSRSKLPENIQSDMRQKAIAGLRQMRKKTPVDVD